jgi:hypothetical protein
MRIPEPSDRDAVERYVVTGPLVEFAFHCRGSGRGDAPSAFVVEIEVDGVVGPSAQVPGGQGNHLRLSADPTLATPGLRPGDFLEIQVAVTDGNASIEGLRSVPAGA